MVNFQRKPRIQPDCKRIGPVEPLPLALILPAVMERYGLLHSDDSELRDSAWRGHDDGERSPSLPSWNFGATPLLEYVPLA